MYKAERVFLMVLDSLGAGEAPDSVCYGDVGVNTLRGVYNTGALKIDNLKRLGIGNIEGLSFLGENKSPEATVARLQERSRAKDTTIGHWELSGYISERPLPTFPQGFDKEIIERLSAAFGRGIICNKPYSGTKVIEDYGQRHLESGDLIVYTSADSVLQIAAHTDVVSLEELYGYCARAREIMSGEKYGVGRIIARPFYTSEDGKFTRSPDRKDFSVQPPEGLLPEAVFDAGLESISVGKIFDIFAGQKFSLSVKTHSNREGMEACMSLVGQQFRGLCFVNFVDFDMLWGHRRDAVGYARGLSEFDEFLGEFCKKMKQNDLLIITADHGCDPTYEASTDHTREYVPCIIYHNGIIPKNLATRDTFADVAATVAKALDIEFSCDGKSMIDL